MYRTHQLEVKQSQTDVRRARPIFRLTLMFTSENLLTLSRQICPALSQSDTAVVEDVTIAVLVEKLPEKVLKVMKWIKRNQYFVSTIYHPATCVLKGLFVATDLQIA